MSILVMPLVCSQFDLKESKEIYEEFQLLKTSK